MMWKGITLLASTLLLVSEFPGGCLADELYGLCCLCDNCVPSVNGWLPVDPPPPQFVELYSTVECSLLEVLIADPSHSPPGSDKCKAYKDSYKDQCCGAKLERQTPKPVPAATPKPVSKRTFYSFPTPRRTKSPTLPPFPLPTKSPTLVPFPSPTKSPTLQPGTELPATPEPSNAQVVTEDPTPKPLPLNTSAPVATTETTTTTNTPASPTKCFFNSLSTPTSVSLESLGLSGDLFCVSFCWDCAHSTEDDNACTDQQRADGAKLSQYMGLSGDTLELYASMYAKYNFMSCQTDDCNSADPCSWEATGESMALTTPSLPTVEETNQEPMEMPTQSLPTSPFPPSAACSVNPGCKGLAGNCCPTTDGTHLDCCSPPTSVTVSFKDVLSKVERLSKTTIVSPQQSLTSQGIPAVPQSPSPNTIVSFRTSRQRTPAKVNEGPTTILAPTSTNHVAGDNTNPCCLCENCSRVLPSPLETPLQPVGMTCSVLDESLQDANLRLVQGDLYCKTVQNNYRSKCCSSVSVAQVPAGRKLAGSADTANVGASSACSAHPECNGLGLGGDCCPSIDGIFLDCCDPMQGGDPPLPPPPKPVTYPGEPKYEVEDQECCLCDGCSLPTSDVTLQTIDMKCSELASDMATFHNHGSFTCKTFQKSYSAKCCAAEQQVKPPPRPAVLPESEPQIPEETYSDFTELGTDTASEPEHVGEDQECCLCDGCSDVSSGANNMPLMPIDMTCSELASDMKSSHDPGSFTCQTFQKEYRGKCCNAVMDQNAKPPPQPVNSEPLPDPKQTPQGTNDAPANFKQCCICGHCSTPTIDIALEAIGGMKCSELASNMASFHKHGSYTCMMFQDAYSGKCCPEIAEQKVKPPPRPLVPPPPPPDVKLEDKVNHGDPLPPIPEESSSYLTESGNDQPNCCLCDGCTVGLGANMIQLKTLGMTCSELASDLAKFSQENTLSCKTFQNNYSAKCCNRRRNLRVTQSQL